MADRNPIYTTDPNDPRLRAYRDSLENRRRSVDDDVLRKQPDPIIPYANDAEALHYTHVFPFYLSNNNEVPAGHFKHHDPWTPVFPMPVQPIEYRKQRPQENIGLIDPFLHYQSIVNGVKFDDSKMPELPMAKPNNFHVDFDNENQQGTDRVWYDKKTGKKVDVGIEPLPDFQQYAKFVNTIK